MISKKEYMKIFDYILKNNDIIDENYITNDLLLKIRLYVKGEIAKDDFITDKHKEIIVNHFLKNGNYFDIETPKLILENESCIKKVLNNDIYSINYLKNHHINLDIINFLLSKKYIISIDSPIYIKKNSDLILNSIRLDCFSVDYVIFELLDEKQKQTIIKELLNTNYCLNSHSHVILKNNKDIIINSINRNVNSYEYSYIKYFDDYDIFKSLIDNNYSFNDDKFNLKLIPLSFIKSYDMLYYIFDILDIYTDKDKHFKELFTKLYYNLISTYPTIKSFNNLINYLCECSWNEYRNNNLEILSNIYSKIIAMIKRNKDYNSFKNEYLNLGNKIANVIGDKYYLLEDAIRKYYDIYHSNNDINLLEPLSLIISKLSSLYIAMEKEQYKKNKKDLFYDKLIDFYIPKINNKNVNRKLLHYIKKQIFKTKLTVGKLNRFKEDITNQYTNLYGGWIKDEINLFFTTYQTKLEKSPKNYQDYLRYIDALKLISRLNQGYIKYSDQELMNYKDIIVFDDYKYKYCGNVLFDIDKCNDFHNKEIIFKSFIKDVMLYINNIEIDKDTYNYYLNKINLKEIINELPFTDEYYEFNYQLINNYKLGLFIDNCISKWKRISNIDNYNIFYEILSNNNLIWLWIMEISVDIKRLLFDQKVKINYLIEIFNNINKIKLLSNYLNINYTDFGNLSLLNDLSEYSDNRIINLIRPEVINLLCLKTDYTAGTNKKDIIKFSADLICQMASKDKSTVPYINGFNNGYHYSMYDVLEDDCLETGDKVDSCLKVCGNDNDFLNYCMLDKNGFIIKITNHNNYLIARAAGFRNGNIIYINQLRTIYDFGGCGYNSKFKSEKEEIIDVLIKACNDIVTISQNSNEIIKIDYVFITKSYAFEKYSVNRRLSNKIKKLIGDDPVDITTEDWRNFINNTDHLLDTIEFFCFSTDYKDYDLICIAHSKDINNILTNDDIHIGDIEAIYKRPRNTIIVTSNFTNEIIRKINKIRAIYTYYHHNNYCDINISDNSLAIIGDNWYLIYNNGVIDYIVQDFDERAKLEFNEISKLLLEYQDEFSLKEKIKTLKNI